MSVFKKRHFFLRTFGRKRESPAIYHVNANPLWNYVSTFDAEELIRLHTDKNLAPEAGVAKNFQGVIQRPEIAPAILSPMAGQVEPPPEPGNWHADVAEWAAAFYSVGQAGSTFRMLELGCGWGCWMINSGVAARRLGKAVELIGIEGSSHHLKNARMALGDNGFTESEYKLVEGVAGSNSGIALFPRSKNPDNDWGAEAIFNPGEEVLRLVRAAGSHDELKCYRLSELAGGKVLDLLHIDIQGAEAEFVRDNKADIEKFVRFCLIGTHSRPIEGELTKMFLDWNWKLEMERPMLFKIENGAPVVTIDGVQFWRNPRLT